MTERKLAHTSSEKKAATHLVNVDYFFKSSEIDKLRDKNISICNRQESKEPFSRHGKPETVISDGGLQFTSEKFSHLAKEWNIKHRTSGTAPTSKQQS